MRLIQDVRSGERRDAATQESESPLWVAPALQEVFGNFSGRFRQYCRLSGLFVRWCSAGLDEFRERGSNRLIDL